MFRDMRNFKMFFKTLKLENMITLVTWDGVFN